MAKLIPLEHPGVILKEEFLEAMGLSAYVISKGTGISATALGQILKGKRSITPTTGLKLSKFLGVSEAYFVNLQTQYDLDLAKEKTKDTLCKITPFRLGKSQGHKLLET